MSFSRLIRTLAKEQYPHEILPPSWYSDATVTTTPTSAQTRLWGTMTRLFDTATVLQAEDLLENQWVGETASLLRHWLDISGSNTLICQDM